MSSGASLAPALRRLPPVADAVDAALAAFDAELDWLLALTPLGTDRLWAAFEASGFREVPPLSYGGPAIDLAAMRMRLQALPVARIESPLLKAVLAGKQLEVERMIELVRLRGTDGFVAASIELFGGVDAGLLGLARHILDEVPPSEPLEADTGVDAVVAAVEAELAWYRAQAPDFSLQVVVDADIGSLMMVSHGILYLDARLRLPRARLQPLVQHEIGTHVVTRYNGLRQPLRQMAVGLAGYEALQEGLGVLAEFLAGFLPGERLRVLAARVVAAAMAIGGQRIPAIFACLHEEHGFSTADAFDIAVRARRGGGLTKDAVYLRGVRDLLGHLGGGGGLAPLFAGKFALGHLPVLGQLASAGWAVPPALLPRYMSAPGFDRALERCRALSADALFHPRPAPHALEEPHP